MIRASAIRIRLSGILRFLAPFGVLPPYPTIIPKNYTRPSFLNKNTHYPTPPIFSFLIHLSTNHSPRFSRPGFGACNRRRDENWLLPPPPIHHALHRAKPNIFPLRILPKNSLSTEKLAPLFLQRPGGRARLLAKSADRLAPNNQGDFFSKRKTHLRAFGGFAVSSICRSLHSAIHFSWLGASWIQELRKLTTRN